MEYSDDEEEREAKSRNKKGKGKKKGGEGTAPVAHRVGRGGHQGGGAPPRFQNPSNIPTDMYGNPIPAYGNDAYTPLERPMYTRPPMQQVCYHFVHA